MSTALLMALHSSRASRYLKKYIMVKTAIYCRKDGMSLVIWKMWNGNLVGKTFPRGSYVDDFKTEESAEFHKSENEATEENVCKYFNFDHKRDILLRMR